MRGTVSIATKRGETTADGRVRVQSQKKKIYGILLHTLTLPTLAASVSTWSDATLDDEERGERKPSMSLIGGVIFAAIACESVTSPLPLDPPSTTVQAKCEQDLPSRRRRTYGV
jgi:hypothetical protein